MSNTTQPNHSGLYNNVLRSSTATSSYLQENQSPPSATTGGPICKMTPCLAGGLAGVVKETQIPFLEI